MPKPRKRQADEETLRQLEEIKQRALVRRLEVAEALLRYERARQRVGEATTGH